ILVLLALGVGMLLAGLMVRYRDIRYTIPFMIQLWLFITPVIYPISLVPERYQAVVGLNPMVGIVEGFRACLTPGRPLDPLLTGLSVGVTIMVLLLGIVCFRQSERTLADII